LQECSVQLEGEEVKVSKRIIQSRPRDDLRPAVKFKKVPTQRVINQPRMYHDDATGEDYEWLNGEWVLVEYYD
jgi:hypothetical protein